MDVDIMNQEESKLKPPSSELDSSLAFATTTGRDQSSSSAVRLRHHRSNNPKPSSVQHPSHSTPNSRHSSGADLQDTYTSMNPVPPQAPPAPNFFVGKSSYVRQPSHYNASSYAIPEEDSVARDPDMDYEEMDTEPYGTVDQMLDKGVQPNAGDNPKVGGQKNFVFKLWQMLNDPSTIPHIAWTSDGSEFTVFNQEEFARVVLVDYFKHSNFSSFVRQLNMYDFHKTNRAPRSTRGAPQHHHWTFSHKCFRQGRPELLAAIKRKAADGPTSTTQYAEDSYASQVQLDRRSSVSAGVRSPPNGRAIDHDAIIANLQRQNGDLNRRLSEMERGYQHLAEKLEQVIQRLPGGHARPPSRLSLRGTTPAVLSNQSPAQHAPSNQTSTLPFNVPVSLDMQHEYSRQSQPGSALSSSSMDSQSPTHPFSLSESNAPFTSTATSGHASMQGAPLASQLASLHVNSSQSQMSVQGTNPTNTVADMSYAGPSDLNTGVTGSSSSYSSQQHQESPVSNYHVPFVGIESFNGNLNSGYQTTTSTPLGQFFTDSNFLGAFSPSQSRIHLGSRNNPVMRTPAPPKGQPPDSTLYQFR